MMNKTSDDVFFSLEIHTLLYADSDVSIFSILTMLK